MRFRSVLLALMAAVGLVITGQARTPDIDRCPNGVCSLVLMDAEAAACGTGNCQSESEVQVG